MNTGVQIMDENFLCEMEELMNDGKFEEVVARIDELDSVELTTQILLMKAHCLSQLAKYREAYNTLSDIQSEVQDDDISYYIELAGVYFGMHKYKSAVKTANHCLEIDENCVEAWLILCLVYKETNDMQKFEDASTIAKELDFDSWDEIFGDKTNTLAKYTEKEKETVLKYITTIFGDKKEFITDEQNPEHPIKVIEVTDNSNPEYRTLVSFGLGAYKGLEDVDNGFSLIHRCEMAAYIPTYLDEEEYLHTRQWVARIMLQFAEMIELDESFIDVGHTISYGKYVDDEVKYNGVLFVFNDRSYKYRCKLPDGDTLSVLQMIPLYEEELFYKIENSFGELYDKLFKKFGDKTDMIYPNRENTCITPVKKQFALPRSSMEELLNWHDADGCYATDRITVDNMPVGIMYRENPHNDHDSGWRFLAGDETAEYMQDQDNMDIFRLNTIANYDPAIIEYLEYPVGSLLYRNKNDEFEQRNS